MEKQTAVSNEYHELLERARHMEADEQLRLLADLAVLVRHRVAQNGSRSIMEIAGRGREIWAGMDAQEYVDRERRAWTG